MNSKRKFISGFALVAAFCLLLGAIMLYFVFARLGDAGWPTESSMAAGVVTLESFAALVLSLCSYVFAALAALVGFFATRSIRKMKISPSPALTFGEALNFWISIVLLIAMALVLKMFI